MTSLFHRIFLFLFIVLMSSVITFAQNDGDIDKDGDTDQADLLLFLNEWHKLEQGNPADFFVDDYIQYADLWFFSSLWDPNADGIDLVPGMATLISGDVQVFAIIDMKEHSTEWEYRVDGIPGGNEAVGTIVPNSVEPLFGTFYAPELEGITERNVILSVHHASDSTLMATAAIRIVPNIGEYVIQPIMADVGLTKNVVFQAGIEFEGAGFTPLNDVYWKVNNVLGGAVDQGKVSVLGVYTAPPVMPGPLPYPIQLGFSFSPESPVVAEAPITLTELHALPKYSVGLEPGPVEVIDASVAKSDNTLTPLLPADITYTSSLPNVADVNANGQIVLGDKLGKANIRVEDNATGAFDVIVAESRSDIDLHAEVVKRSNDFVRIERNGNAVTEIEYTRPGAMFSFIPIGTIVRGDNAGNQMSTVGSVMSYSSESDDIEVVDSDNPQISDEDRIAYIDKDTGFVTIGDMPGRGTITATYDDGLIHKSVSMDVIFSRIEVNATAEGNVTRRPDEVLITEYIHMQIECKNPNGEFFGDVPLRIRLLDEQDNPEIFLAAYHRNRHTGNGVQRSVFDNFFPFQFNEFTEFELTADSSARIQDFVSEAGKYELFISPKRSGIHRFQIEVLNDPGVVPVELTLNVVKPKMVLQHPPSTVSNATNFVLADTPVVANSWVNVYHRAPESAVSPYDLVVERQGNTFSRFAHNDTAVWTVTDPQGRQETLTTTDLFNSNTASRGGTFSKVFGYSGMWKVKHAVESRPEIETEEFTVNVVESFEVENVPDSALKVVTDPESDMVVPRSNQLGAFEILSPIAGGWAPGVPIPVVIQSYSALGEAKAIGKAIHTENFSNTSEGLRFTGEFNEQHVVGVRVDFLKGFTFFIDGSLMPDSSGKISFNIVPTDDSEIELGKDLIAAIKPQEYTLFREDTFISGIPLETRRFVDGEGGILEAAPFGITEFADQKYKTFNQQCLFVSGGGLAACPRQLPIPSERVQTAVADQELPSASQYTTVVLNGNTKFGTAINSGIAAITFPDETGDRSVPIISSERVGANQIKAVVDIRFQTSGERFFRVVMNDGSKWEVILELVRCKVSDPGVINHSDKNIAMNGRHHNAHEPGSQQFNIENLDSRATLHKLELELIPSIQVGDMFRGAVATSPIVGFDREYSRMTGTPRVFNLKQDFFQRNFSAFMVFGNNVDQLTLDPVSKSLIPGSSPDHLPDFVSAEPDAEKMLVTLSGNMADYYEFAAYNFIAEVTQDIQDPMLGFDDVKDSISMAYSKYSGPAPNTPVREVTSKLQGHGVAVSVDKEAPVSALDVSNNLLNTAIPDGFYAGMLDQYFQKKLNYRFGERPSSVAVAKDGRVRAFNGERSRGLTVTGRDRRGFGVELDSVLYDPKLDFVFDVDPNSSTLLNIPIVRGTGTTPGTSLTNRGLVQGHGGTSGGYFDLDKEFSGSHQVVAKTPGQQFPGIHAGYLIQDTTGFLTHPYLGDDKNPSILNDIENVILKREAKADPNISVAGDPIKEDKYALKLFGQISERRRVHGFAANRDRKDPIHTSLYTTFKYQVTTDPPGFEDNIPVVAGVWVREEPRESLEQVNLLVNTQSDGSEEFQKALIDFAIDLSVNLTAQITLAALSGGVAAVACGDITNIDVGGELFTAFMNFSLANAENYYFDNQVDADTSHVFQVANSMLRDGQDFIPYVESVQLNLGSFVEFPELKDLPSREKIKEFLREAYNNPEQFKRGLRNMMWQGPNKLKQIGLCSILGAPFEALKGALKDSVTVEGLGGGGAASAIGERHISIAIPPSAWRSGGGDLYTASYSFRRVVEIIPKEPDVRDLFAQDVPIEFQTDPAEEDDVNLIKRLLNSLDNPDKKDKAQELLRLINRTSMSRTSNNHGNIYRDHKFRYGRIPGFDVIMSPNGELEDGGKRFGNYMFRTDETAIDVTTGSLVWASRSNENAGARAVLTSNGYAVRLKQANIPDPFQARFGNAKVDHRHTGKTCCDLAGLTQYDEE